MLARNEGSMMKISNIANFETAVAEARDFLTV